MYGPGQFSANTDVQFGTTNNKQTIHTVCLPTTTTIVDYNPTPPRHHPLPTAPNAHMYGRPLTTNTNENDDDDVATPSHEPKQPMATIDDNAPNTSTTLPLPMATTHHPPPSRATHTMTTADVNHNERRWSVQVTTWQRAMSSRR